jgi:glycerophosphoryl diester phosphodiesterase
MLIIAHRGASADEPENTLLAFQRAIEQGAQMIELDLDQSADGHVIVMHDATLERTTNMRGSVAALPLAEIRKADAGKGERVPTLDEVLDLTLGKVRLYLEIKEARAAANTLKTIRARGCESDVMLASFDLDLMERLGREVNDIELGLILGTPTLNPRVRWREAFPWRAFSHFNYQVLCLQVELCFGYLAHGKQAAGKRLYVWTADSEKQFEQMRAYGVDGIVTNRPARLHEFLAKK